MAIPMNDIELRARQHRAKVEARAQQHYNTMKAKRYEEAKVRERSKYEFLAALHDARHSGSFTSDVDTRPRKTLWTYTGLFHRWGAIVAALLSSFIIWTGPNTTFEVLVLIGFPIALRWLGNWQLGEDYND